MKIDCLSFNHSGNGVIRSVGGRAVGVLAATTCIGRRPKCTGLKSFNLNDTESKMLYELQ